MTISARFCPVCGAANELARTHCFACGQPLTAGTPGIAVHNEMLLHERYQIETTLGSGGFSAVYRARDLQAGREVAIKQISLSGLSAEEAIEATETFNREVSLLSELHHPQVPQMYEHFNDREHWYLVLEYLVGSTLETYLETRVAQGKPIQVEEILAIALQLCTVLEYLHTRQPPIIFRDLKPGNIIRAPGGKLSLIDFGIARHYRLGQAHDTQKLGSPGYAAPEQYGRAQTTPQSDIYSLGALLHAMLSGQDPSEHPHGLAPLPLERVGGTNELAALIQRMLSPNPGGRPANVSIVVAELTAIRQQRLAQNSLGRIWLPPTPQAQPAWTGAQFQVSTSFPSGTSVTPPKRTSTSRRRVLIGLGVLTTVAVGIRWLDVVINSPAPSSGPSHISTYTGHTGAVTGVAWSPDGRGIASCSEDTTVQIWSPVTGDLGLTYRGHTTPVRAVAWSPDGTRVVSSAANEFAHVWNAQTGAHLFTNQEYGNAAVWSPDSVRIASTSWYNSSIQVWDADNGGYALTYQGHHAPVNTLAWSPDGWIASGSSDTTIQV